MLSTATRSGTRRLHRCARVLATRTFATGAATPGGSSHCSRGMSSCVVVCVHTAAARHCHNSWGPDCFAILLCLPCACNHLPRASMLARRGGSWVCLTRMTLLATCTTASGVCGRCWGFFSSSGMDPQPTTCTPNLQSPACRAWLATGSLLEPALLVSTDGTTDGMPPAEGPESLTPAGVALVNVPAPVNVAVPPAAGLLRSLTFSQMCLGRRAALLACATWSPPG